MSSRFLSLRWPRGAAVAACGVIGFVLPAVFGLVVGYPEPHVHDEFSYLLAADTLAQGRLTNSVPPVPQAFEAPHILVEPRYNSKFPPGQPVVLAIGQIVGGHPIWGVWLSCGAFAASLCWMLQAWTSRHWALAISILVITTLGTSTYWAQSYWGGMLPATGGALVYGGARRLLRSPHLGCGIAVAIGLVILVATRPYEGLLVSIPAATLLTGWLLRNWRSPVRRKVTSCLVVSGAVLIGGVSIISIYNTANTTDFRNLPYAIHHAQYFHQGLFLVTPLQQPSRTPVEHVAKFYNSYQSSPLTGIKLLGQTAQNLQFRLIRTIGTAFATFESPRYTQEAYRGVLLWVVLLVSFWARSRKTILATLVLAVVIESLAWKYLPLYPVLLLPLIIPVWVFAFAKAARANGWARFLGLSILAVIAGQSLVWWWLVHYAAPVLPLVLIVVATTIQRLARAESNRGSRSLGLVMSALLSVQLATAVLLHLWDPGWIVGGPTKGWVRGEDVIDLRSRGEIRRQLMAMGGSHLVFVEYDPDYSLHREWVYNGADPAVSPIIFAHDLGEHPNAQLVTAYPGRTTWLVRVSMTGAELKLYGAASPAQNAH